MNKISDFYYLNQNLKAPYIQNSKNYYYSNYSRFQKVHSSMQDIINSLLSLIAPKTPPGSAIFIVLVAVFTSAFSTIISRRFIDLKKLKLYTKKTKEFRRLQSKALKSQDPILKKKLENQTSANQRMQSELAKMRFKPLLYTMLPMIIIFFALSSYYNTNATNPDTLVGDIPFSLPETFILFKVGFNCQDERIIIGNYFNTTDYNSVQTAIINIGSMNESQWLDNYDVQIRSKINTNRTETGSGDSKIVTITPDGLVPSAALCLKNPKLTYVPTYIGWYIFVNVII